MARKISFSMEASPTPDVLYRLYESYEGGEFLPVLDSIGQLQFDLPESLRDGGFPDGTYEFYVTAYKGEEESVPSNTVSTVFTRPEPPTNLVIG